MIFSYFTLRIRQLAVLEPSSFIPFRAYFGPQYLEEPLTSQKILLVDQLVPVEIQHTRVVRLVLPIFEHKFVFEHEFVAEAL